jgi:hypothetical protein
MRLKPWQHFLIHSLTLDLLSMMAMDDADEVILFSTFRDLSSSHARVGETGMKK